MGNNDWGCLVFCFLQAWVLRAIDHSLARAALLHRQAATFHWLTVQILMVLLGEVAMPKLIHDLQA